MYRWLFPLFFLFISPLTASAQDDEDSDDEIIVVKPCNIFRSSHPEFKEYLYSGDDPSIDCPSRPFWKQRDKTGHYLPAIGKVENWHLREWVRSGVFYECFGGVYNSDKSQRDLDTNLKKHLPDIAKMSAAEISKFAIKLYKDDIDGLDSDDQNKTRVYLLHLAADLGDPEAMHEIALNKFTCRFGSEQDVAGAVKYFRKAAEAGDPYAQHSYATVLLFELTDEIDFEEKAVKLIHACSESENETCRRDFKYLQKGRRSHLIP